jgi:PTH1 family peptidyl-tRNA hydrolase
MKLIIGLGNIGPHFDGTRHNVGFEVVNLFAVRNNLNWQDKEKFKAHLAEGIIGGEKIIAVRPTTYYNLAGDAVQAIKHFYKIENNDILAVHDELALPFGIVRTRPDGSAAGNNGIKSIIAAIGDDFPRIRIGIANQFLANMDAADFVLGRFTQEEVQKLADIKKHASMLIEAFASGAFEHTTFEL